MALLETDAHARMLGSGMRKIAVSVPRLGQTPAPD